uniref:Receptor-type tyrosine-protein phosphatase C n=1 Tax=Gouania willdenowi TaxID=441366 RepID=A0A8C5I4C4_GOUWI
EKNIIKKIVFHLCVLEKDDIVPVHDEISGSVCYQSGWNITLSNRTQSTEGTNKTCFKPEYEEVCSTITTEIKNVGGCGNSSSFKENITVDFLNTMKIQTTVIESVPASITTTFPSKCANLSVDYTCTGDNVTKSLSDLEPYTSYTCTGLVKNNNVTTNMSVSTRQFKIKCGTLTYFMLQDVNAHRENTSIGLKWTTTNTSCMGVPYQEMNISYSCVCSPPSPKHKEQQNTRKCNFSWSLFIPDSKNLLVYFWHVHLARVPHEMTAHVQEVSDLEATNPEHNVIKVKCKYHHSFKGPEHKFIAYLSDGTQLSKSKCEFEFKDLSYSTEYKVEVAAFNGKLEGPRVSKTVSTQYNDKAVIGFLVFLIIITSLALLFVVYKIYLLRRRRSQDIGENIGLITAGNDEDSLMSVEPMSAEILKEAFKRKYADEARLFFAEFQTIPRIFSRYTVKEARRTCNAIKNRYVDILPYDYTRVQLSTGSGQAGSDYINASFINGFSEPKKYIAAQGPKTETVCDFWRMIWEQQSSIIVMVTQCEEGNKVKCAKYWPADEEEAEIFEEFVVKLNSEDHFPDYHIRHLSLINKKEKNSEREVTQIQFMSWPDHGVPGEPQLLLKLRRRVNAFKNRRQWPHAGVGRTGTYISIDAMMECLEAEGRVDVYGSVVELRRQRGHMVQVEPQYILIHQALLEHNQFGETEISLSELHSTLSTLYNSDNEPTLLEEEFERLPNFPNWRHCKAGITEENKKKNRSMSAIPYDYNRVLLRLDEGQSQDSEANDEDEESSDEEDEESTKYINASHIDGYWGPRVFITAQTPLTDTVEDFWFMVYQKQVPAIAMLSDEDLDSVYWNQEDQTFGEIEVKLVSTDTFPTFISRDFLIRHVKRKKSRTVKHFQFLKWEGSEVPEKPEDLTEMIKNMKVKFHIDKSQRNIVVHCSDGSSRSGIFCALWNLLDSAETEKLVDVFQVAKTLRKERQGMFSNLEHYQFLYKALENLFPVPNGEAKPTEVGAGDSVQMVNETKAEEPLSTTSNGQQGAAADSPLMIREEDEKEKQITQEETDSMEA